MAIRQNEAQPYKEYQIAITSSASAAQLLALKDTNGPCRVEIEPRGDGAVVLFGNNSSIAASNTLTSQALPNGNFSVQQGAIVQYDINGQSQQYVSVISDDAESNSGAYCVIRLCVVNK